MSWALTWGPNPPVYWMSWERPAVEQQHWEGVTCGTWHCCQNQQGMFMCFSYLQVSYPDLQEYDPPLTGKFTVHHSTFKELSDFFKMSEALEPTKNEKQIQPRWVCSTLLTATPSDTINPELLRAVVLTQREPLLLSFLSLRPCLRPMNQY